MGKRKVLKKPQRLVIKLVDTAEAKKAVVPTCVGCSATSSLLQLDEYSFALEMFPNNASEDVSYACVYCTYHANLVSEMQTAMLDTLKRPVAGCLICRSTENVHDIKNIEGAAAAFKNPIIKSPHITPLVSSTRKLCITCAYTLQWLNKKSASKNETCEPLLLKISTNRNDDSRVCSPVAPKQVAVRSTRRRNTAPIPKEPMKHVPRKQSSTCIPEEPINRRERPRYVKQTSKSDLESEDSDVQIITGPPSKKKEAAKPKSKKVKEDQLKRRTTTLMKASTDRSVASRKRPAAPAVKVRSEPVKKSSRTKVAPERFQVSMNKKSQGGDEGEESKEPVNKKPKLSRGTPVKRRKFIERKCKECSKLFYSGIELGLHELEHSGRNLTIRLERCVSFSYKQVKIEDSEESTNYESSVENFDKKCKKKKIFVFGAPKVLTGCSKSDTNDTEINAVDFDFVKPHFSTENGNDFSEDENSDNDNTNNADKAVNVCLDILGRMSSNKDDLVTGDDENGSDPHKKAVDEEKQSKEMEEECNGTELGENEVPEDIEMKEPEDTDVENNETEDTDVENKEMEDTDVENKETENEGVKEDGTVTKENNNANKSPDSANVSEDDINAVNNSAKSFKNQALSFDFFDDPTPKVTAEQSVNESKMYLNNSGSFDVEDPVTKSVSSVIEEMEDISKNGVTDADSSIFISNDRIDNRIENSITPESAMKENSENPILTPTNSENDPTVALTFAQSKVCASTDLSRLEKIMSDIIGPE